MTSELPTRRQVLKARKSGKVPPGQVSQTGNLVEALQYLFYPDHLGRERLVDIRYKENNVKYIYGVSADRLGILNGLRITG